jgi:xanthine dehydrogenase YagS FAD-binding subunit
MQPFKLIQVQATPAAVSAVGLGKSRLIAGGTNLVDLMKFGVETPERVIDITALPLRTIEIRPDGTVQIGALVTNSELAYHPELRERYPVLSQALLSGASPQLRNMATVGGNLMQRTRCPYFYDLAFACNKRTPGTGCPAVHGFNRSHAILGTSERCIATHPSDLCVALAALDAVVQLAGNGGSRSVPLIDFHFLPKDAPEVETALGIGELITGISIPPLPFARRSHYLKVRDRASFEFALASAAVALEIQYGRIRSARVALGGVGTKPWRSPEAEMTLVGATATEATYRQAADAALKEAKPQKHNAFKVELAKRTMVQTLRTVGEMYE